MLPAWYKPNILDWLINLLTKLEWFTFNVERDVETIAAFLVLDGEVVMAAIIQLDALDTQPRLVAFIPFALHHTNRPLPYTQQPKN